MKPGDFLIGVLDFFAILLPGSIATWLVTRYVPQDELFRSLAFGPGKTEPDSVTVWTAFLLASYVLGHFVFFAGSRPLDKAYDRWRRRTKPLESDKTYLAADALRKRLTPSLSDSQFTTFKWAKSYIQVNAQHARTEIDRFEADSKFFRSLVVISLAVAVHFMFTERAPVMALLCVALSAAAYWRFKDQRWKMTELSYGTAVILAATKPPGAPAAAPAGGAESNG